MPGTDDSVTLGCGQEHLRTADPPATAVLCGDLNMLRCFAGKPVPTLVVCNGTDEHTLHSRHCRLASRIASPRTEPQQALEDLLSLGRHLTGRPRSVLFYGDDAMLMLVSRHREELSRFYRFLMPDAQMIEQLISKSRFALLAARFDLPVPATLLSSQVQSSQDAAGRLSLPCILKPDTHVGWFQSALIREEGGRPQKVLRADTPEEFHRLFTRMRQEAGDFIVQEYVDGGDDCIYSFHAYLDADSRPLAYYVGRKIRTYPKGSGVSTYIELVREPQVVRIGLSVLRKLRFVGVVKLDFKKDLRRNRFCLLEVNPRFNLWNHLGAACGVNLPYVAYLNLCGRPAPARTAWRTGVRWLSFSDDARAFVREYRRDGDLSWLQWLWSLRGPKVHDVFDWRDPGPWAAAAWTGVKDHARKWLRRWRPDKAPPARLAAVPGLPPERALSSSPSLRRAPAVAAAVPTVADGGVPSATRFFPTSTPTSKH